MGKKASPIAQQDYIRLDDLSPANDIPPAPEEPSLTSKIGKTAYKGAGYFDMFVIGFLQPGWPAFLCTFILQVMAPYTIGSYVFLGACLLAGGLMMGIKYFYDHVDRNASRITALQDLTKGVDKELKDMIIAKSAYLNWLMARTCQSTINKDLGHSYHRMNAHFEKFHKGATPVYITQQQVEEAIDLIEKTHQHNATAIASAEKLASKAKGQFTMYAIAALITLVGMAGLLFFTFLTFNAVILPLADFMALQTVKYIAMGVAGVASAWGVFKMGEFIHTKYHEFQGRKAAVLTLKALDAALDNTRAELEAVHVQEQELERAYELDHQEAVRPETFAKEYECGSFNAGSLNHLLSGKTKKVSQKVSEMIHTTPQRSEQPGFLYGNTGKPPVARSLAQDFQDDAAELRYVSSVGLGSKRD